MSKKIDMSNLALTLRPQNKRIKPVKPKLNVGGKFDHYNGTWHRGKYGESILNGGLSAFTAFAGKQNQFKTTTMRGLTGIAFGRMVWLNDLNPETTFVNYGALDTESQQEERRWETLYAQPWYRWEKDHINDTELWQLSDTQVNTFNEWMSNFLVTAANKRAMGKKIYVDYPFLDQNKEIIKLPWPSFLDCDTLSQAKTDTQLTIQQEKEISGSGRNMLGMTGAKEKSYVIDEIPPATISSLTYLAVTVQMRDRISMDGRPLEKIYQDLNQNIKFAGVPQNFLYLPLDFYAVARVSRYTHSDAAKGPRWPRKNELRDKSNPDLNQATFFNLRGKSGVSGLPIRILVSQTQGYLPHLTMLDDLYENDYGILGNRDKFQIAFLPEVDLTRTTARTIIEENEDLRTALELQSSLYYESIVDSITNHLGPLLPKNPFELYDAIKKDYDWNNVILKTRSWYTPMNDKHPIPFLSIMDLINMKAGFYKPYWLKKK